MDKTKIKELINRIIQDIIYQGHDTLSNRLDLMKNGLEIITATNREQNISNEDKVIVKRITEELINLKGNDLVVDMNSYIRKRINEVSEHLKEELSKLSYIETIEPIETFDNWIKSLRIFKMNGIYLKPDYYENSYDLYSDMRKIVLKRNSTEHQKIYTLRISEKLLEKSSQQTLPNNITLEKGDYELSEIIKLMTNNPQYYYSLKRSVLYHQINDSFESKEKAIKLYLLTK